jgi:hypothetical protein
MKTFRTHYDNLQVAENASPEVVRGAYRYLSQKWHPDKNPDKQDEAARIMRLINTAYEVLSDPQRRKEYDEWIAAQRKTAADAPPSQSSNSSDYAKPKAEPPELIIKAKRWVAVGYFLFAVALLVYGLSAWFSPIGGPGWTGRGPMHIPMEYVQTFERFIGAPFGLLFAIYVGPIILSGTLMIIGAAGVRFPDSGGQMFGWAEISRCEDNKTHIILGGIRNGKKWEKRFIRSMVACDAKELVRQLHDNIQHEHGH